MHAVANRFGDLHEFRTREGLGEPLRGARQERERVATDDDRHGRLDADHRRRRRRDLSHELRVVDGRLGERHEAGEDWALLDLLDEGRVKPDALELEGRNCRRFVTLVDQLLQALGEISRGLVLAEAERRLRQEQMPHRHAERRREEREHGARRVPDDTHVTTDRADDGRKIFGLPLWRRRLRVSAVSASPPVVGDSREAGPDQCHRKLRDIARRRERAIHDDHHGTLTADLVGDARSIGGNRDLAVDPYATEVTLICCCNHVLLPFATESEPQRPLPNTRTVCTRPPTLRP